MIIELTDEQKVKLPKDPKDPGETFLIAIDVSFNEFGSPVLVPTLRYSCPKFGPDGQEYYYAGDPRIKWGPTGPISAIPAGLVHNPYAAYP